MTEVNKKRLLEIILTVDRCLHNTEPVPHSLIKEYDELIKLFREENKDYLN